MRYFSIFGLVAILVLNGDWAFAQESKQSSAVKASQETVIAVDDSVNQSGANSGLISNTATFIRNHLSILYAILVFIVSFIVLMYLRQPLQRLSEKPGRYASVIKQIIPIFITISWFLVVYIIVAEILNPVLPLTIAIMVILGFAAGLAIQDTLKDIIAGLILPFENHIEIGNKIQIDDLFGEITRMGLREVELKRPDGNVAILPSAYILKKSISNVYTEKDNCPVVVDFYIPLTSNLDRCREIAHKSAIISPYIYLDKPVLIRFENISENDNSLVKMHIEAYLLKIEFQPMFTSELTECVIKELLHATNASIA